MLLTRTVSCLTSPLSTFFLLEPPPSYNPLISTAPASFLHPSFCFIFTFVPTSTIRRLCSAVTLVRSSCIPVTQPHRVHLSVPSVNRPANGCPPPGALSLFLLVLIRYVFHLRVFCRRHRLLSTLTLTPLLAAYSSPRSRSADVIRSCQPQTPSFASPATPFFL